MKLSLVLGLVVGTLISVATQAVAPRVQEGVTMKQVPDLELSLVANKRRYKRNERINLEAKLTNTSGVKDVFVYGTLEFGFRGSLMFYHRDAQGKEMPTKFFPEALEPLPEPNDTSAFVKLLPNHFLGTYYRPSIRTLNMVRPGRYTLWVEYHCPISTADVKLSPFWGSENGTIKSNVVEIEVIG